MSLVGQYSDSESEEEENNQLKKDTNCEDEEDNKIPISKVNEKPYGLIITEEVTKIINKDTEEFNIEEDFDNNNNNESSNINNRIDNNNINNNNNNNNSNNKNKNKNKNSSKDDNNSDDEITYQVADSENDKLNNCHTILHTKLENRDIDIPKEVHEPKTPTLTSPAYVSTPPHSKDPNFRNLYPHNITSPMIQDNDNDNDSDDNQKEDRNYSNQKDNNNNDDSNQYFIKNLVPNSIKKKREQIDMSFLPPVDNSKVDPILEEKIIKYHKMRNEGININQSLRESQSFRNPSILEKLIAFCEISELGSNYKKSEFNPFGYKPEEFYEALNESQRKMDEKREYERLNRSKIDFVSSSNTSNNTTSTTTTNDQLSSDIKEKEKQKPKKKYNKWEKEKYKQKQQQLQQQQQKAKATVISAAPSIKKRENPTTQPTTTSTNTSESLLKRFRTNGF